MPLWCWWWTLFWKKRNIKEKSKLLTSFSRTLCEWILRCCNVCVTGWAWWNFIYIKVKTLQYCRDNPNNQTTPCKKALWQQWKEKKNFNRKKLLAENMTKDTRLLFNYCSWKRPTVWLNWSTIYKQTKKLGFVRKYDASSRNRKHKTLRAALEIHVIQSFSPWLWLVYMPISSQRLQNRMTTISSCIQGRGGIQPQDERLT